jgi:hypothetical protein
MVLGIAFVGTIAPADQSSVGFRAIENKVIVPLPDLCE